MATSLPIVDHRQDTSQFEHKGEGLRSSRNGSRTFKLEIPTPIKNTASWIYDVCVGGLTKRDSQAFTKREVKNLVGDYITTGRNFVEDCKNSKDISSVAAAVCKLAVNLCIISPAASLVRLSKIVVKDVIHLIFNGICLLGLASLILAQKCKNGIVSAVEWCKENPKKALVLALLITACAFVGIYFAPLLAVGAAFVNTAGVVGASLCVYLLAREIFNCYSYRKRNKREDMLLQQITILSEAMKANGIKMPENAVKMANRIENTESDTEEEEDVFVAEDELRSMMVSPSSNQENHVRVENEDSNKENKEIETTESDSEEEEDVFVAEDELRNMMGSSSSNQENHVRVENEDSNRERKENAL